MTGRRRCARCPRAAGRGLRVCAPCRQRVAPTLVLRVMRSQGWSSAKFAKVAGISQRWAIRASNGEPLGSEVAAKVHRVTRVDVALLLAGEPADPRLCV